MVQLFFKGVLMNLMRKSVLFVLVFLLFSNLYAFDEKGVKAGIIYSTITGYEMDNAEFSTNFSAGVFANKRLNNWLVIQSELLFSSKGSNYSGEEKFTVDNDGDGVFDEDPFDSLDNDGDGLTDEDMQESSFKVKGHYKLYYLEVPVLIKFLAFANTSKNVHLLIGPSFNILLDSNYKLKDVGYDYYKGNLTDLKPFDISSILGIVYTSGKYQIELRGSHSLIENKFKTVSEVYMEAMENHGEIFGPGIEHNSQYIKFAEARGYNASISLLLSYVF